MQYQIVTAANSKQLMIQVNKHIEKGWKPQGNHIVVESHRQNRFSGTMHKDTIIELEYSQTMILEDENDENKIVIDVGVYFDDDGKINYDEEGMREDFEYKLSKIIK